MGGLGVLFVIGFYFLIASAIVVLTKPRWLKAIALIVVLLIPTADAIYGRIKLKYMCEAEAGLKVNRVVEHVDGFMANTTYSDYWVREQDYKFAEDRSLNGVTTRYTKQPNGQIVREDHVQPKSQYRLREIYADNRASYSRIVLLTDDMATGEILATDTWLAFNGGWAERLFALFSDSGGGNVARCSNAPDNRVALNRLVNSSLKH